MAEKRQSSLNDLVTESIALDVVGSGPMRAYVARPASGEPHPGLIVFQEAYGVNSHIRDVTERFAAQGYLAIAPELFHRTAPAGFEGDYNNFPSVRTHYQAVTDEAAEADTRAAYDWLHSHPQGQPDRISAVGFCMGGKISFLANSVVPLHAAVSFYGGGIAQTQLDRVPRLHGAALLFWGGLDKHITPEHRRAVVEALTVQHKRYVNVEFSSADHAFFCDQRGAYEPNAARQAWALTLEFLRS